MMSTPVYDQLCRDWRVLRIFGDVLVIEVDDDPRS